MITLQPKNTTEKWTKTNEIWREKKKQPQKRRSNDAQNELFRVLVPNTIKTKIEFYANRSLNSTRFAMFVDYWIIYSTEEI